MMKEENKPILGQWCNNMLWFSDHEKKLIIEDYLSKNETKKSVYKQCTGYPSKGGMITI